MFVPAGRGEEILSRADADVRVCTEHAADQPAAIFMSSLSCSGRKDCIVNTRCFIVVCFAFFKIPHESGSMSFGNSCKEVR